MEALAGTLALLGILVALVFPSLTGLAHERRIERQLREAEKAGDD